MCFQVSVVSRRVCVCVCVGAAVWFIDVDDEPDCSSDARECVSTNWCLGLSSAEAIRECGKETAAVKKKDASHPQPWKAFTVEWNMDA